MVFAFGALFCYEASAASLVVTAVSPSTRLAAPGATVTWEIFAEGGSGTYTYYFDIYLGNERVAGTAAYGSESAYTLSLEKPGIYKARGYVKDRTGAKAALASARTVVAEKPQIWSVTADLKSPVVGDAITWTVDANDASVSFYFDVFQGSERVSSTRAYTNARSYTFTPNEEGLYFVRAYAKDAYGRKTKRASAALDVTEPLTISSFAPDRTSAHEGDTIVWTVEAEGGKVPYRYFFDVFLDGVRVDGSQAYDEAPNFAIENAAKGSYVARAYVKDGANRRATAKCVPTVVTVKEPLAMTIERVGTGKVFVGDTIVWRTDAEGGLAPYRYYFDVYRNNVRVVGSSSYGGENAFAYTLEEEGTYFARGYVKDANGERVTVKSDLIGVGVVEPIFIKPHYVMDPNATHYVGDNLYYSFSLWYGVQPYAVSYEVYLDGKMIAGPLKGEYNDADNRVYGGTSISYETTQAGTYTVRTIVTDARGNSAELTTDPIAFVDPGPLRMADLWCNYKTYAPYGVRIEWVAHAEGGKRDYTYYFDIYRDGVRVDGSTRYGDHVFVYEVQDAGKYSARAYAKDRTGAKVSVLSETVTMLPLEYGNFETVPDGSGLLIRKYKGNASVLGLPDVLGSCSCFGVCNEVFRGNKTLTRVYASPKVTYFGEGAFRDCPNLRYVEMTCNDATMGRYLFAGCPKLVTVKLPYSAPWCPEGAFINCTSLRSMDLPAAMTIKTRAFDGCTALESVTVSDSLWQIDAYAFRNCKSLKEIILPNSGYILADNAFVGCDRLTTVGVSGSMTEAYAKAHGIAFRPIETDA